MKNESLPDPVPDPTTADFLAKSPPAKRRSRRGAAKNLGVYDADRDILDQYLYEVSKTPLLTPQQEILVAKKVRAGDGDAMRGTGCLFACAISVRSYSRR